MGFRPEQNTYHLTFEGTKYDGLKVSMTALSVGELLDSMKLADSVQRVVSMDETSDPKVLAERAGELADAVQATRDFYESFARHLIDWNVERQDESGEWVPVPPTLEGVSTQDPLFIKDIVDSWRTAVSGVKENLGAKSSGGEPALEASLPMEPLSTSPPS